MSELIATTPRNVNRRMMVCGVISAGLMVLGVAGLYAAQNYWNLVLNKPPAPLSKPLNALADSFGRFSKKLREDDGSPSHDGTLSEAIVESLGTKEYLLRTYIDSDARENGQPPWRVALNLNYYSNGDASPHVPDRCWVANGRQPPEPQMVTIRDVVRKDGSRVDLEMRMLSFFPTPEEMGQGSRGFLGAEPEVKTDLRRNVAYIFHVNGQYVSNPLAVSSMFWSAKNKYAYHAKIEVTMEQLCTPEEAKKVLSDFMRDSLASIEECLPDPRILTEGVTSSTMPSTVPAGAGAK